MNYKAVWKPLQGSQSLSLSCPCNEILYEGTRGPGKTAAQLARFRRLVGLGYGSFWRGVIFDTEYKNLTDIITQSKRMHRLLAIRLALILCENQEDHKSAREVSEGCVLLWQPEQENHWRKNKQSICARYI